MKIDIIAAEDHYASHLLDVWAALPDFVRGDVWAATDPAAARVRSRGFTPEALPMERRNEAALVAGYGDVKRARRNGYAKIALIQHGAGQSYGNRYPAYPGGDDHDDVSLFICPNVMSAERWAARYPTATAVATGSPRVEHLPKREGSGVPTVAVSFHWLCTVFPETRPAFMDFRDAVPGLMRHWRIIGHGHPRAWRWLKPSYKAWGIDIVPDFEDVCRLADVYVCDNSSTIFEFAATGRPVVLLNAKAYRRNVDFGLRFWDCATVGIQVNEAAELEQAVSLALVDPKGLREERERVVRRVYANIEGSTAKAVQELVRWVLA